MSGPKETRKITVGELIRELSLSLHPRDNPVTFEPFTFYRVKDRCGETQIELREVPGIDYEEQESR